MKPERDHNTIDLIECKHQEYAENLPNNNDNAMLNRHELMIDAKSLSSHICKLSLRDDSVTDHNNLMNMSLTTVNDNSKDLNMHDPNLVIDGPGSVPLHVSMESSYSQSALSTSALCNHCDETDDGKIFSNPLNNNNNKNSDENVNDENVLPIQFEHVCKETLVPQDTGSDLPHCSNSAVISKPFKLPILEKLYKTANVQQSEVEENATALVNSSFIRQDQLQEVRCLDSEPRSSNSSEESNSDIESRHTNINHNEIKAVTNISA